MRVIVRARPFSAIEKQVLENEGTQICNPTRPLKRIRNTLTCFDDSVTYKAKNEKTISKQDIIKDFRFDQVFGLFASQQEVYAATAKPTLAKFLEGYNGTIFAYGATGCGKTFTMFGDSSHSGIVAQSLQELFTCSSESIYMSYTEIYNERMRDLISSTPDANANLNLREGSKGNFITNFTQCKLNSVEHFMELVEEGNKRRAVSPTYKNEVSSRSHAILSITRGGCSSAALSFVDLAGSERASKHQSGARYTEGTHINKSLLALGNCVNALAQKAKHIPYRDSKLTRVLKASLEGNSVTAMIACVSPSSDDAHETLNTLTYATTARGIRKIGKLCKPKMTTCSNFELQERVLELEVLNSIKNTIIREKSLSWESSKKIVDEWIKLHNIKLGVARVLKVREEVQRLYGDAKDNKKEAVKRVTWDLSKQESESQVIKRVRLQEQKVSSTKPSYGSF